ncbi:transcriptional regulator [Mangrovihabitans endophyticus]|uniref:Transcriptional regulator n=1 Tax=Mangrovihabitans endophyticus TaxID=1751298 RepID=A0A8J3BZA6_9ACTN|nr:transcriptional regulator [Mangrovihabitans endophyticus]
MGSGRPAELLALDPHAGQYLGVDLQHARVRVVVADATHEIIAGGQAAYPEGTGRTGRPAVAFDLIDRIAAESGINFQALQGVGVGVVGPDADGSRRQVTAAFAQRFAVPVVVDNNTRFAALAEAVADGTDPRDLVYIRLSDGIGGGVVVGGRLVAGGRGMAGEFGHIAVDPSGVPCRCGKRGCLETIASVPAVLRACGLATLGDLAQAGPAVHPVLDAVADAVGRVLAEAALILNPEQVVIAGNLATAAPRVVTRAASVVAAELTPVGGAGPTIRSARLGDDDGARGAIAALFRQTPLLTDYPSTIPAPGAGRSAT